MSISFPMQCRGMDSMDNNKEIYTMIEHDDIAIHGTPMPRIIQLVHKGKEARDAYRISLMYWGFQEAHTCYNLNPCSTDITKEEQGTMQREIVHSRKVPRYRWRQIDCLGGRPSGIPRRKECAVNRKVFVCDCLKRHGLSFWLGHSRENHSRESGWQHDAKIYLYICVSAFFTYILATPHSQNERQKQGINVTYDIFPCMMLIFLGKERVIYVQRGERKSLGDQGSWHQTPFFS